MNFWVLKDDYHMFKNNLTRSISLHFHLFSRSLSGELDIEAVFTQKQNDSPMKTVLPFAPADSTLSPANLLESNVQFANQSRSDLYTI